MNWIDFTPAREGFVTCPLCDREIGAQRIARGAHAAWHFKQSTPSYFDDPIAAKKLRDEALSWIGTPFRQYYQQDLEAGRAKFGAAVAALDVKGLGGGIDCVGLVQEIFTRSGATQKWIFPRTSADYQSHQLGEKILDWLRGKAADPQSEMLGQILVELKIPDAVKDPDAETPRDFFKPGDILVMKHGALFHMPVIVDNDLHFVNAVPRLGVIEGTIQDSSYSTHLVAAFRLKPQSVPYHAEPFV
jgi:cell wall-associated NlpC family hydrolase